MKALSIHPYYVMGIAVGEKTIECRTWATAYRGDLLICSTAKKYHGTIPGHALAVVTLIDVVPFEKKHLSAALMKPAEYKPGCFAWLLSAPRCIVPFKVDGALSLWDCEHEIDYLPAPKSDEEDIQQFETYWKPLIV